MVQNLADFSEPPYCPLDDSGLEFGGELAGYYWYCNNCEAIYPLKENTSQVDLIQAAKELVKNNGKELRFLQYSPTEIKYILYLAERKGLCDNIKRPDVGMQLSLNLFAQDNKANLSAEEEPDCGPPIRNFYR